jgi:hypothetical protein
MGIRNLLTAKPIRLKKFQFRDLLQVYRIEREKSILNGRLPPFTFLFSLMISEGLSGPGGEMLRSAAPSFITLPSGLR